MRDSALYKEPVDPAKWFGIRKDATVLGYSQVVGIEFLQQVVLSEVLQEFSWVLLESSFIDYWLTDYEFNQ